MKLILKSIKTTNQNIIPAIENNPIFFAQITDTLLDVTIPDSNIANRGKKKTS